MNADTLAGDFKKLKGKIKEQWSKLTDNDLQGLEGNADQLEGRIQKAYGYTKERAQQEYAAFKQKHKL